MKGSGGFFFFQAEDGIRDLVRSRGLGDVYKRQLEGKDVLGCAQTGTGKTAAFALPIIQRLMDMPVDLSLIHI